MTPWLDAVVLLVVLVLGAVLAGGTWAWREGDKTDAADAADASDLERLARKRRT